MAGYQTHQIVTPIHARYLIRVPESETHGPLRNRPMLVGFHGYGEAAETQLSRLETIPGSDAWVLVSIQGLHRFYTRGGQVVSSWMTSQDRDLLIDDNLRYVRSVVTEAVHLTGEPQAMVFVGFSQGVAMAWRAALLGGRRVDGLVTLGGDVPPEFAVRPLVECPPVLVGRGEDDTRYPAEKYRADLEMLASRFVPAEPCEVPGGHEWTQAFADEVGRFLARIVAPSKVGTALRAVP